MFNVYYSNQLEEHKALLVKILSADANPDPFAQETVLVQSLGMAQWLQMQIAHEIGITGNIQFPYPTSFLWQQYRLLFPDLPKENIFERSTMTWRLMRLIPQCLTDEAFLPLAFYLKEQDQLKRYQLAAKIADLFDQYLVYRPHWLICWEKQDDMAILNEITHSLSFKQHSCDELAQNIRWQGILWRALVADIKQSTDEIIFTTSHRAYLQQRYFDKLDHLTEQEKAKLPKRIFVFGISALPLTQLAVLKRLSEFCHIHLFFTNPSEVFWGDLQEDRLVEKLALNRDITAEEIDQVLENQGNPLLAAWGKQGKEFLNLLLEQDPDNIISLYSPCDESGSLLEQVKQAILNFEHHTPLRLADNDTSIQIHACHSKMREVEVLYNQLLSLFAEHKDLSPKDIIVMSSDIDNYAPYINAVFSRYDRNDPRHIPFTLSDQKISYIDPIIASFLTLLSLNEKTFSTEEVLDLFNVSSIRDKYQLTETQLLTIREWVKSAGIRAGLNRDNTIWQNYNSWENGLNRLLLGTSLKEGDTAWQEIVPFSESYGLNAELSGVLAKFLENLTAWSVFLQQPQSVEQWITQLTRLIEQFYSEESDSADSLFTLHQALHTIEVHITEAAFQEKIDIEVIYQLFEQQLNGQRSNLNFLVGKVNFCTLLPMRAIPFKVVCLLGMNEGEFPRQQTLNSFDLMQYAHQKGDRAKRDDDRYLFLEALLSAQKQLYISYIGRSLTDNQKKLPSILVSQLVDYLSENLVEKTQIKQCLKEHAMTVFSRSNFIDGGISYDKEWLKAKSDSIQEPDFLTEIQREQHEQPSEVSLDNLIAYIQDPIKFFFNQQLGIYLEQREEQIDDAEIFTLSGLERYRLLDELVELNDPQAQLSYFRHAKLKGNLPACYFGEITEKALLDRIKPLNEALQPYLAQEGSLIEIDHAFDVAHSKINLTGYIPNLFGTEIVLWRAGELRDKDCIKIWLYYLMLIATGQPITQLTFYSLEKSGVRAFRFKPLDKTRAVEQLSVYLNDYLSSFTQLKWAYLKEDEKVELKTYLAELESPYLQRVMSQTTVLDLDEIAQRIAAWFGLMLELKGEKA